MARLAFEFAMVRKENESLMRCLRAQAPWYHERRPPTVILGVESWVDNPSQDYFHCMERLVRLMAEAPSPNLILWTGSQYRLALTFRPDWIPPWVR